MERTFLMFLDHTQRRTKVGRALLDEWSARRRDLYLTTHDTHNRQISMPPVGFEPTISAGEWPTFRDNLSVLSSRVSSLGSASPVKFQKSPDIIYVAAEAWNHEHLKCLDNHQERVTETKKRNKFQWTYDRKWVIFEFHWEITFSNK